MRNLRTSLFGASLFGVLLALAIGATARADIAPPRPEEISCPRGAVGTLPVVDPSARDVRGRPVQPYPYCAPSTCASDSDCTGGLSCSSEEIALCVQGGPVEGDSSIRVARDRGCEPDGTCLNASSTCERARRCVREATPVPTPPPDEAPSEPTESSGENAPTTRGAQGCGCAVAAPSHGGWAFGLLPFAFALAFRRRSVQRP